MQAQSLSVHVAPSRSRALLPALSAMLLGFMLILLVGFAPVPQVHNAAHDTRHTADFPCH